jgi:hypothetical protein
LLNFDGYVEKFDDSHYQLENKVSLILQSGDEADLD